MDPMRWLKMAKKGNFSGDLMQMGIGLILFLFVYAILIGLVTSTEWWTVTLENETLIKTVVLVSFPLIAIVGAVIFLVKKAQGGR